MGPRHLAQCYRCRRTFEANRTGTRYCPDCERMQRRRFQVIPGGREAGRGRLIVHPRSGARLMGRGVLRRRSSSPFWDRIQTDWRWRRWHQPLRLLAVITGAVLLRTVWDLLGGGPWPIEWVVYAAGAYWIWNRRDVGH